MARLDPNDLMLCPRCENFDLPDVVKADKGPHEKKVVCNKCGCTFGFLAKEKNEKKLDHRPNGCPTPEMLGIDYCQICLRHKSKIGKGHLDTHHIDGNPANNDRLNYLVVCVACHRLIHWTRTYIKNHMEE